MKDSFEKIIIAEMGKNLFAFSKLTQIEYINIENIIL